VIFDDWTSRFVTFKIIRCGILGRLRVWFRATATRLSFVCLVPFVHCSRDPGSNRPPEIAATVDGPRSIELNCLEGGVNHGLSRDDQRPQGRDRQTPIPARVRVDGFAISFG